VAELADAADSKSVSNFAAVKNHRSWYPTNKYREVGSIKELDVHLGYINVLVDPNILVGPNFSGTVENSD
jgi:hypothetical protein